MSRIGRMPIQVPQGVEIKVAGNNEVTVKGPKGTLTKNLHADMIIKQEDGQVIIERPTESKEHKSLHGLTRTLFNNMVIGVTEGFKKTLEINGVGYRCQKQGKKLVLTLGYSHPVEFEDTDDDRNGNEDDERQLPVQDQTDDGQNDVVECVVDQRGDLTDEESADDVGIVVDTGNQTTGLVVVEEGQGQILKRGKITPDAGWGGIGQFRKSFDRHKSVLAEKIKYFVLSLSRAHLTPRFCSFLKYLCSFAYFTAVYCFFEQVVLLL